MLLNQAIEGIEHGAPIYIMALGPLGYLTVSLKVSSLEVSQVPGLQVRKSQVQEARHG